MQKLLTVMIAGTLSLSATAQDRSQGEITYTISIPLPAKLKQDMPELAAAMPAKLEKESIFTFKGRKALISTRAQEDNMPKEGGISIQISSNDDQATAYLDMDSKQLLYLVDVAGRSYLYPKAPAAASTVGKVINNSTPEETGEKKKILGYECRKVVVKGAQQPVSYWYTTQLPVTGSPFGVMTEKGVVLQLDAEAMSFKADEVRFKKVDIKEVTPPANAQQISAEAYQELKKK